MANLLITWQCNRHCTYCFARVRADEGPRSQAGDLISLEHLEEAQDFFLRSKISVVGLLGGEPGLHPELAQIVERLLTVGLNVRLFTGGLIPEQTARYLAGTEPERVRIVINMPGPGDLGSKSDEDWFWKTMSLLVGRGAVGYTIRDPQQDLRFLSEAAQTYRMNGSPMRLGLASPCIDDPSPPVLPTSCYPDVARRVLELAEDCARRQATLEFDCGFPRCMFTEVEHERLRALNVHAVFQCSSVVDIGPDLNTWSCFPLKAMGEIGLRDVQTRDEIITRFRLQQRAYRNFGIYDRCMDCHYKRNGECSGGCLAHVIRGFTR